MCAPRVASPSAPRPSAGIPTLTLSPNPKPNPNPNPNPNSNSNPYSDPNPNPNPHAKVAEFKELKGKGPAKELKLQHVEASLDSLAAAAGIEPSHVRPFLEQQGIQQQLDGPPGIEVKIVGDLGAAPLKTLVEIEHGTEPANLPVDDARLKELMLEFQAAEAR